MLTQTIAVSFNFISLPYDPMPTNLPHNLKIWDVVCDFKRRHQYNCKVNTGAKIERVLHTGDLVLKDCYGIHKYENFVLKKTHTPKFKAWDIVKLIGFPEYYDIGPSQFVAKKVDGTAVYYGLHSSEFYVDSDIELVARPNDHQETGYPGFVILIGMIVGYLIGKFF